MTDYIPRWFICQQTVTHPNVNRAQRRLTTLIETDALPLSYTLGWPRSTVTIHWVVREFSGRQRTNNSDLTGGVSGVEPPACLIVNPQGIDIPLSPRSQLMSVIFNKGQSSLAKGDKARMQTSCRYLVSRSPSGSTCREVGSWVCIWNYFGERAVVGSQRWYHSKERWWFPIGSPLWPQFAVECLRRLNQQVVDQFGAKFVEEGIDRC